VLPKMIDATMAGDDGDEELLALSALARRLQCACLGSPLVDEALVEALVGACGQLALPSPLASHAASEVLEAALRPRPRSSVDAGTRVWK